MERFILKEAGAVLEWKKNPDHFPDSISGFPVGGDFTWAGFAVSLAEIHQHFPQAKIWQGHRPEEWIRKALNREAPKAQTFSQFYLLLSLRCFGPDTNRNALWKSLNSREKETWKAAADVRRMYDPVQRKVLNGRPRNYLAVAAQVASLAREMGLSPNTGLADSLVEQGVEELRKTSGWLNDGAEGEFRFDRYHFEFLRFLWESAYRLNRKDLLQVLEPYCAASDRLWVALLHPRNGNAFCYGRSLQNTWEDSWEYTAWYFKRHPNGPSDPISQAMERSFFQSWNHYREEEYDEKRHLSRMLDPGRGCYGYVNPGRVWGYSFHALGKMVASLHWEGKNQNSQPDDLASNRKSTAWYTLHGPFGLWIWKTTETRLVIPFVTGMGRLTPNDYQPIPFAEGITGPPVAKNSSHGIPALLREGKSFVPVFQIHANADSLVLESKGWWNKTDSIGGPVLRIRYKTRSESGKNRLDAGFWVQNSLASTPTDTLVWSCYEAIAPKGTDSGSKNQVFRDSVHGRCQPVWMPLTSRSEEKGAFVPFHSKGEWRCGALDSPNWTWVISLD